MIGAEAVHAALVPWANYYVITGSAAAALTGLQFVAQALVAQHGVATHAPTTAAFGTPTVVHFVAALVLSAAMSAPWPGVGGLRLALLAAGVAGTVYIGVVLGRARRQTAYATEAEDWVWHVALPAGAYGGVALSAGLLRDTGTALFAVAALVLLLLCVAIHNAWDGVAYLTARLSDD